MPDTHPSPRPSLQNGQENENEKLISYVLDSFAILALAQKEKGHTVVADLMLRAENGEVLLFLSLINWGEILYILERDQGEAVASEMMKEEGKGDET